MHRLCQGQGSGTSVREHRLTVRSWASHQCQRKPQDMSRHQSGNAWIDLFNEIQEEELVDEHGDTWTLCFNYSLTNELTSEKRKEGWKMFEKPSYGSFTCSNCSHFWNSARICIVFHYRLRERAERGQVLMRPFRQQCRECTSKENQTPRFNDNKIEEILMILIGKSKKNCYHVEDPDERTPLGPLSTFRTTPHQKELCEACQQGICTKA
ncbi:receptor-transporting protein 3-like isoform X1 [Pleurodeles waltl]|uniref:receptor-transporting protein 3-like isoform X1 n=1 Tax=Pleurodeles waltl TaxID=8319 RepID=UPI0037093C54